MSAPEDVSPREAAERWLSKREIDLSEDTLSTYWYRIKQIVEFCEAEGIERLADLSPWKLDEFDARRRARNPAKVSISKEYRTMNTWLEWAESLGVAQDGISGVLDPPKTTTQEEVNDDRLDPEIATATIRAFRGQPIGGYRASLQHVLLELEWWTGARMGAIRGIDMEDVDLDEGTIEFRDRPETGTPIKPAHNPERKVGIQDPAAEVLRDYVDHVREEVVDEHRRRPLLTTGHGRVSKSTIRRYSYYASLPCQSVECPHDRDPPGCEWNELRSARSCPSARGPHAIRTGAITNLRNSGWVLDDIAERVNTSPKRLIEHYDFPTLDEQYRERRADQVDLLRLDTDHEETTDDE